MIRRLARSLTIVLPAAALAGAAAAPTVADLRHHRRVLIVAAPSPADARLAQQRRVLAGWRGARDRDVTLVTVSRDRVTGAADRAKLLRRQWHLPPGDFAVVLVGKDGREALRSPRPLSAATLQATIDAMPMRRAGQR